MNVPENGQPAGLRERKKARTREAIQDHALRLYLKQGYAETTVEQIAEAAEVSQSTFFRYFPTKHDTVLYDRFDPIFMAAILNQPPEMPPLAAVRTSLHEVMDQQGPQVIEVELARWRLIVEVPELRAAAANQVADNAQLVADAIATRVGREPDDFAVWVWVGALIGAIYAGFFAALKKDDADFLASIDAAIAQLEDGIPL